MIVGYGFDEHFKQIIKEHIPEIEFVDVPLQEAPLDIRSKTTTALVFVFSKVDEACLKDMSKLETVIALSAGTDHIDFKACEKQGIEVYNTPEYGSQTVAEQGIALLLCFERHLIGIREKDYTSSFDRTPFFSRELRNKTLGVVGTGAIGKSMVSMANGFNMNILAYDIEEDEEVKEVASYVSLNEMCEKVDYLSLHVPFNEHTEKLIGKEQLDLLSEDSVVINTARARVIDEDILVEKLQNNELRGALLDVYTDKNYEVLKELDNTIVTPHNAFYTRSALNNMAEKAAKHVLR